MPEGPAAAFLEGLGLEPRPPEPRFFEDLFLRFATRFAYETVTRVRGAAAREPEEVFRAFADEGRGSAGRERALAFLALAGGLGFDVRLVPGARQGRPHAAVVARLAGRDVLADAGFPLPVLVPLDPPAAGIPTPYGRLSVARREGGAVVLAEGRGRIEELVSFDLRLPGSAGQAPGGAEADESPFLLRLHDDRLLRWSDGLMEVVDPWSRLVYPLAPTESAALEALFDLSLEGVALSSAGREERPGLLTVYDLSRLGLEVLLHRLATPGGHLALQPRGTTADDPAVEPDGWSHALHDEAGRFIRRDRVIPRPDGALVETLEGESPVARRVFTLTSSPEGTRVALEATLARPVPARGAGEPVRKTLVFHLASELLALSRDDQ